ncbi:MAG: hypothetical protein U5L08_02665 [Xanthomonadales bacterium]|nr:hypothetical protein [Xanthomonadales bacterium]
MNTPLLPPPYRLAGLAGDQFRKLQIELGGIVGAGSFRVWRVALMAEHQSAWIRGGLTDELLTELKRYRSELGLSELPDLTEKRNA